ncbi:MAG: DUF2953 domain-containing protein [Thaumarchaeota archaeon]|nr:DUF2953 domain-containing protein [Nitrososphaerota archaeon]
MILEIVAIVLTIFLALIVAVLLIPFHLVLNASFSLESTNGNVKVSWLGLTLWRNKPSKPKKPKEKNPKKKKTKAGGFLRMFSLFRDSIPAFVILARSVRRAINLRRLDLDLVFGLGDPAETAIVAGYLWSFAWVLDRIPGISFAFRPAFQEIQFNGSLNAEVRVRVLPILLGFLRAYTKKPFRQLIGEVRAR